MTYEEKKKEQVPSVTQSAAQPSVKKEDIANKILSRGDFSFDVNEDALYDQYAQQYARMGQQAMTDTMARAQAMTGGYGNSYAQNAGQQAYQNYMLGMNDVIPELYQMALDRYMMEGDQLMTQYNILADREALAREQARYDREWEAQQAAIAEEQRRYDQEWEENLRRYEQEWAAAHPEGSGGAGGSGSGANWLRSDGSVNMNMVSQSSQWWKDYAARNGLDPKTGKPLDTGTDYGSEYQAIKDAGATSRELDSYLRELIEAGEMTQEEANELRNRRP